MDKHWFGPSLHNTLNSFEAFLVYDEMTENMLHFIAI